jgi:SAM-dependent methyltransferase
MNEGHLAYLVSDAWRETLTNEILPWVLEDHTLGADLLELGPGPGLTTDLLRGLVTRLTAVEIDEALAAGLAARLAGTNVEVLSADATDLPLLDDAFDSVACLTMLHHVPTADAQDRLLAEAHRVVRPGGILVGYDSIDTPMVRDAHEDDVFNPVDPATFSTRLQAAGFGRVETEREAHRLRFIAVKPG